MNAIAVFIWKGPLPSDDEVGADPQTRYSDDFGEQWAYQACQPVATAVLLAVRDLGRTTDVDIPYFGDIGWHFDIHLDQRDYEVTVQWVDSGDEGESFAVKPTARRGCLAFLFLPRPAESSLRPVCDILQAALGSHPQIANLRWVDRL